MYVTRRETFNAAHRVYREDFTDEENAAVFGKCSNPLGHGHNYTLFVTVKGKVSGDTGFVIDLKHLSELIFRHVIDKVDHRNINLEVDFMKGRLASAENLAIAIWGQLEGPVEKSGGKLHCIKLVETENNFVEYYGEE